MARSQTFTDQLTEVDAVRRDVPHPGGTEALVDAAYAVIPRDDPARVEHVSVLHVTSRLRANDLNLHLSFELQSRMSVIVFLYSPKRNLCKLNPPLKT